MSLNSMTGHGRGNAGREGWNVGVEVSSVNRRQLDVAVSLPNGLLALEPRISESVRRVVSRGRVSVAVTVRRTGTKGTQAVQIDNPLAVAYVKSLRQTAKLCGLSDDIGLQQVLSLPDVVRVVQPEEDAAEVGELIDRALQSALKAHTRTRRAEGRALRADLEKRIQLLRDGLARIREEAPQVKARYQAALRQRLSEVGVEWDAADERLIKEVVLFADRSDITEEITRLESHFQQARRLMRGKEPAGRTLDFLAQEMFREINTIGSKASDSAISEQVVLFKAELERIREQVQNIE